MESMLMSLEESRRTQRPYRYGMILLCVGALINWVGLADNYPDPIRYIGVACIIAGALLICTAMCCWLHKPPRPDASNATNGNSILVISTNDSVVREKPPDYETIEIPPPSYNEAIKLNPSTLLQMHQQQHCSTAAELHGCQSQPVLASPVVLVVDPEDSPSSQSVPYLSNEIISEKQLNLNKKTLSTR